MSAYNDMNFMRAFALRPDLLLSLHNTERM
jgi:hypothetical protein